MNITRERMFVNLLTQGINILEIKKLDSDCLKYTIHLKYNRCIKETRNNYIVSKLPEELTYIKKFIRKITYSTENKKFVFFPVNCEIDNIIIYK